MSNNNSIYLKNPNNAKTAKNGFKKPVKDDNFKNEEELPKYINNIIGDNFSFLEYENITKNKKNQSILANQEKEYLKIARNWTTNAYNDIQYNRFIPDNFYRDTINLIVGLLKKDPNLDLNLTANIKKNIQIEAIINKLNADNPDYFTKDDDKKYLNNIIGQELDNKKEPKDIVKEVNAEIKKINQFAEKKADITYNKLKKIRGKNGKAIKSVFTDLYNQQNPKEGSNFRGNKAVKPGRRDRF